MNKNGGSLYLSIIIGIIFFIIGILIVNLIKTPIDEARSSDSLDCNNLAISDGAKFTCLGVDLLIPYFIVLVLSSAGGYIFGRLLL
jgi:hypothetical protein